ncbi:MAG: hypothetical protein QOF51_2303, partial [Chloroflexota bacterium]|nr:hypothetical protein [Chloroflexota bacterium]
LGDALQPGSRRESQTIGRATYELLFHLAADMLASDVGLVFEGNFYRGLHEAKLAPLIDHSRATLIHCHAPMTVALERYEARAWRGERHPVHFDFEVLGAIRAEGLEAWYRPFAQPLELSIPSLVVDTTLAFPTDVTTIVEFVLAAHPNADDIGSRAGT